MKNRVYRELVRGIFTENAIFVLILGLCPTLGVTTSALNGFSMGIATTVVLILSNMMVSSLRKGIPSEVRIPVYIVLAATAVTIIDMLMHAYFFEIYKVLGIFIPLIVVNCIILGRAEVFASKNNVFMSFIDGLGSGLGFTFALTALGIVREFLGTGKFLGITFLGENFQPMLIAILPPGAFIVIGLMMAGMNAYKNKGGKK